MRPDESDKNELFSNLRTKLLAAARPQDACPKIHGAFPLQRFFSFQMDDQKYNVPKYGTPFRRKNTKKVTQSGMNF
jgi:hypothetical protein